MSIRRSCTASSALACLSARRERRTEQYSGTGPGSRDRSAGFQRQHNSRRPDSAPRQYNDRRPESNGFQRQYTPRQDRRQSDDSSWSGLRQYDMNGDLRQEDQQYNQQYSRGGRDDQSADEWQRYESAQEQPADGAPRKPAMRPR